MSHLPAHVMYRWTPADHDAAQASTYPREGEEVDPRACVTPYLLLPQAVLRPKEIAVGSGVTITLGRSYFPWSVSRFDLPDHEWRTIPESVTGYRTIRQLFQQLFANDAVRYDLFDPARTSADGLAKLAHLVFEHWDNTEYRLARVSSGSYDEKTLRRDVLDFETEVGGKKVTHVPTREVLAPPIRGAPQPPGGGAVAVVVPEPLFAVTIALRAGNDDALLTPLSEQSDQLRQSRIKFDVTIKQLASRSTAEETLFRVLQPGGAVLFEQSYTSGDLVTPGARVWEWDGFSSGGVLDTRTLGPKGLTVEVSVKAKPGKDAAARATIHGARVYDWVDAKVNEPLKRISLRVYLLPYRQSDDKLSDADFRTALQIVQEGIAKHWTRTVTLAGEKYQVDTSAQFNTQQGVPYTIIGTDDPKKRSCNLRLVNSALSVWFYYCKINDQRELRETAAHEFGHTILGAALQGPAAYGPYGFNWSLTHKGSSTALQGESGSATPYPLFPGECDVMLYYKGAEPEDAFDRTWGTVEDVKHLLAAAQIRFKE